jgi:hypothetical protein
MSDAKPTKETLRVQMAGAGMTRDLSHKVCESFSMQTTNLKYLDRDSQFYHPCAVTPGGDRDVLFLNHRPMPAGRRKKHAFTLSPLGRHEHRERTGTLLGSPVCCSRR